MGSGDASEFRAKTGNPTRVIAGLSGILYVGRRQRLSETDRCNDIQPKAKLGDIEAENISPFPAPRASTRTPEPAYRSNEHDWVVGRGIAFELLDRDEDGFAF